MEGLEKEIGQLRKQIKHLQEKERLANDTVEGLMMDATAAEEEIKRWKMAAAEEAEARRSSEQELESPLKSSMEAQDLLRSQADSARSSMFTDEEFKSLQLQACYKSWLESPLKSSMEAQDLLRSQADSARSSMFTDEEFKSLQLQVTEINLLRESNIQLREEKRQNSEECQKFREEVHKAKMEAERLDRILLEKQADAEVSRKELEMQKTEIANLNQRISELVENSRGVDLKTYETMKAELQNVKLSPKLTDQISALTTGVINLLNTGSLEDLQKLKGIKKQRAASIIKHRGSCAFEKIDDLRLPDIDMRKKRVCEIEEMLSALVWTGEDK